MHCPACLSNNVALNALNFHRLSFVQHSFRRPFPKKQPKHICHNCGHVWLVGPYTDVREFPLPEVFHHPRHNLDNSQIQSEKHYADQLITTLQKQITGSVDFILDLRMLSGRTLMELKTAFSSNHCIGFDWYAQNIEWAKKQYGHTSFQYPTADPLEYLHLWLDENPELENRFDIIFQSQSILEFTARPRQFMKLVLRLLHPNGKWAIYEQFIDQFPRQLFLHELFDPWGKQYFCRSSFEQLATGSNVRLVEGFDTATRRLVIVENTSSPYSPTDCFVQTRLFEHPEFESHYGNDQWVGWPGKIRGISRKIFHQIDDRINTQFPRYDKAHTQLSAQKSTAPTYIDSRPVIDVLVVSCGRPQALQKTIWHFQKMCHSESRRFRFLVHDDWIDSRAQDHINCRRWINECRIFDEIHLAENNRGISQSVNLLLSRVDSELYVHLEDDMVFIRPVNFDPLYKIFFKFDLINQIRFNRTENKPLLGSVSKIFGRYRARMFKFDDTVLCLASFWSNQANISRTNSPFTDLMATVSGRFHERIFNLEFAKDWLDPFDAYTKLGTFMYGPIKYAKVVYETGQFSSHTLIKSEFPEDDTLSMDKFRIQR